MLPWLCFERDGGAGTRGKTPVFAPRLRMYFRPGFYLRSPLACSWTFLFSGAASLRESKHATRSKAPMAINCQRPSPPRDRTRPVLSPFSTATSGGVRSGAVGGHRPPVAADVQRARAAGPDFRVEQDPRRGGSQAAHKARFFVAETQAGPGRNRLRFGGFDPCQAAFGRQAVGVRLTSHITAHHITWKTEPIGVRSSCRIARVCWWRGVCSRGLLPSRDIEKLGTQGGGPLFRLPCSCRVSHVPLLMRPCFHPCPLEVVVATQPYLPAPNEPGAFSDHAHLSPRTLSPARPVPLPPSSRRPPLPRPPRPRPGPVAPAPPCPGENEKQNIKNDRPTARPTDTTTRDRSIDRSMT